MTRASQTELPPIPSPEERPEAEVIIYDGHCRFCQGQVQRLARWDRGGRLAYLSLHDPVVGQRYPDLSHDQLMDQMYLIDRRGRRHGGAAAFRYLTKRLPTLWLLAPLMNLPGTLWLWQSIYRRVARARYRWGRIESCDEGSCATHLRPR